MSRRKISKNKKFRLTTGFFLYVFIALFSLSCCGIFCIANSKNVADTFTSYSYVESLKADIIQYTSDRCSEASISDEFAQKSIDYDTVHQLEESYIYGMMNVSDQYTDKAFDALMNNYEENLVKALQDMVNQQGVKIDSKDGLNSFCSDIANYTRDKIEFKYATQLKSTVKKVRILSYVVFVISAIMLIVLSILMFKKGGKNYKVTRNLAYSFLSAFILDYILLFAGLMVKLTKNLVIYPLYLANAFMGYYDGVLLSITFAGAICLLASVIMATFTWRFKRNERE